MKVPSRTAPDFQNRSSFMAEDDKQLTQDAFRSGEGEMSEAEIDYNVMGTFPASDPPSWTLGVRRHKTFQTEFEGEKPSVNDPSHQNQVVSWDAEGEFLKCPMCGFTGPRAA
jgi:hypothetical protein